MADIDAGITYGKYLMTGPNMGNKYFLNSGAQCTAADTGKVVDMWTYLDQSADQPLLSQGMSDAFGGIGSGSSGMKGLLPGIFVDLADLSPLGLLQSLTRAAFPPCQQVSCPTGDVMGDLSGETHYVLSDKVSSLTSQYGCVVPSAPAAAPSTTKSASKKQTFLGSVTREAPPAWLLVALPVSILVLMAISKN
jgi:hypothetical protein